MNADLERQTDYKPLFRALIDKTKAGRLPWEDTADEYTFLCVVEEGQRFEISKRKVRDPQSGQLIRVPVLKVRDADDRWFYQTPEVPSVEGEELFQLARRVATQVDERIKETVELVNRL